MSHSWPKYWFDLPMAVFDLETTGFDPVNDQIIEIGIALFEQGKHLENKNWLVDPGRPIPPEVVELTGIRQEDVEGQPRFEALAQEVLDCFKGRGLVAYNLNFDKSFLTAKFKALGLDWPSENPLIDPLIFAQHFYPRERNRLGMVAERLGIKLSEAHRASHDAQATGQVLYAFRDRLPPELEALLLLQSQWERENSERFHAHKKRSERSTSLGELISEGQNPKELGPTYIYGNEIDPLRALYAAVPNAKPRTPASS